MKDVNMKDTIQNQIRKIYKEQKDKELKEKELKEKYLKQIGYIKF